MATGSLDSNGIWIYGEDDSETTFSGLLNKLGDSVSDKFTGGLAIASGGTGATTVAGALNNLGVKFRQVITQNFFPATVFSTSTTWVDTGLTLSITPSSSSNKILIIASQGGVIKHTNDMYGAPDVRLMRGATVLGVHSPGYLLPQTSYLGTVEFLYIDSPSTTSPTTYKIQFRSTNGSQVSVNNSGEQGNITLIEVA